jgi:hypothetical protein
VTVSSPADEAIFIGGIPRSGTSLMRDIVGAHPDVAMFPSELPLWRVIAVEFAGQAPARRDVQARLVGALVNHPRVSQAGIILDGEAILNALADERVVTVGSVFAHTMRQYARQQGRPRWGVKDPLTEFHADRIFEELPRATFVHMIRDPRDVVTSQRGMWGAAAQHVVSTTDAWRRSAALARRRAGTRGYVAVRYEDLVADPAAVVRRVCEALGLTYRPEMLERSWRPRSWRVSWDPELAGRHDIFQGAVARHARQLHDADACFIQLRAGREMARWGYAERRVALTARDRGRIVLRFTQEAAWRAVRHVWSPPRRLVRRSA